MSASFDPTSLIDDETGTWSFDAIPPHEVLALLADRALTGLLRLRRGERSDALYLREGQPVGVELAEVVAPLGQLLLELGDLTAASYVAAQRLIDDEGRLPGQVYVERGLIDSARLKAVLQLQAARKAQRFVEACRGPFEFSRGLSFLTGFVASSLDMDRLILQALQTFLDEPAAERVLTGLSSAQLRAPDASLLRMEALGYGHAEERFVARLSDWQTVEDLDRYGTLPRRQMALLLRFMQLRRRLQLRPVPERLPLAQTDEEARVFAAPAAAVAPARSPGRSAAPARATPRREKTERISIELPGWSEPRAARVEKTEPGVRPSVVVDYAVLGIGAQDVQEDDDEDDDAAKNTSPTIRIKQ